MARIGRPTKLTDELIKELCAAIRWGAYVSTALAYVGISDSTYRKWRAKGRKAKSGKYRSFLQAIKKAEADSEIHAVQGIRKHGKKAWQALAWLNERKHPERWVKRDPNANKVDLIIVVETISKIILAINKTVKNNEERLALTAEIERLADELKSSRNKYKKNGNGGNGNGDFNK